MRTILFRQAILIGACCLIVASCAYPHPGPKLPEGGIVSGPSTVAPAPAAKPVKKPENPVAVTPVSSAEATVVSDHGNMAGMDAGSDFDNIDFVDASLNGKLTVLRVGSQPSPNGLLSIFAGLKNKTARQLDLELQTIYKDQEGNQLNEGSWIPFTLKPHEEKEYHSTSISSLSVDFLVRVRRATAEESQ